jgi:hypothetical protein
MDETDIAKQLDALCTADRRRRDGGPRSRTSYTVECGVLLAAAKEIRDLRDLLRPFAALPVFDLYQYRQHPETPVFAINGVSFNANDVIAAKRALLDV